MKVLKLAAPIEISEYSNNSSIEVLVNDKVSCKIEMDSKDGSDEVTVCKLDDTLQTISEAGVDITEDLNELKKQYITVRNNWEEIKLQKRLAHIERMYKKDSVHSLAFPKIDGVTFRIETLETMLNTAKRAKHHYYRSPTLTLIYSGAQVKIDRQFDRRSNGTIFSHCSSHTNFATRKYKSLKSLAQKFVILIDTKLEDENRAVSYEETKRKSNLQLLLDFRKEICGDVQLFKEDVWNKYQKDTVTVYTFKLYGKVIKRTYGEDTYSYGGFDKLTADQVVRIVEIVNESK
jgi:hypothetical protein